MKCGNCNGAGSAEHVRCLTCKGTGEVKLECVKCGGVADTIRNERALCEECEKEEEQEDERDLCQTGNGGDEPGQRPVS